MTLRNETKTRDEALLRIRKLDTLNFAVFETSILLYKATRKANLYRIPLRIRVSIFRSTRYKTALV